MRDSVVLWKIRSYNPCISNSGLLVNPIFLDGSPCQQQAGETLRGKKHFGHYHNAAASEKIIVILSQKLILLRAYPNNYLLSPVILNGAERSVESPLHGPDSSASPQNDKG